MANLTTAGLDPLIDDSSPSGILTDEGGGAGDLTATLYVDTDSFFTPLVTGGSNNLIPSLYTSDDSFFSPTVTGGAVAGNVVHRYSVFSY